MITMKRKVRTYEVRAEDVGKHSSYPVSIECVHCGHMELIYPFELLGYVKEIDIGRRCLEVDDGIWQVESLEQRDERIKRENKGN